MDPVDGPILASLLGVFHSLHLFLLHPCHSEVQAHCARLLVHLFTFPSVSLSSVSLLFLLIPFLFSLH